MERAGSTARKHAGSTAWRRAGSTASAGSPAEAGTALSYVYSKTTTTEGCHGTRPNEHNTWAVDDMHKSRSVDQSVSLPSFVEHAVRARVSMSHTILQPLSPCAKQVCVWHVFLHALTTKLASETTRPFFKVANKTTQQLYKVSTPCIDDHHFKEEEMKIRGRIVTSMLTNCCEMFVEGLTFYQTRSNAIILQGTLPAYCIPKVVRLKTGEVLYEISYMSPRPPPKISLRHDHDWTRGNDELGSTVEQQPVGKIVRQSCGEVQRATFSHLTQPKPKNQSVIDQGNLIARKMCWLLKVKRPVSMRSMKKRLHKELGSSDRSGKPDNLAENTRVEQTHDGSGQPDERNSSSAHTVKEQLAPEENRDIALFNTDNEFNRKINEGDIDFNIPGLPHSAVKQSHATNVQDLIQKIENHPHRQALQSDLQQRQQFNPFSKESKQMILKLGTSNCVNYSTRNPKHSAKYVCRTGTSASSTARAGTLAKNISCIALIGLIASGKYAWQEGEETRKDSITVLVLQEQLCISELFRDTQDAILLIFRCRTMW